MSEGTTRETKLTDSEAKMLRERVKKYESFAIGAFGAESARVTPADCMASLSELLLAAKERSNSDEDWGDLFDGKV